MMNHKPVAVIEGQELTELLNGRLGGWMFGNVVVQNAA